jgi:hypothetical protein
LIEIKAVLHFYIIGSHRVPCFDVMLDQSGDIEQLTKRQQTDYVAEHAMIELNCERIFKKRHLDIAVGRRATARAFTSGDRYDHVDLGGHSRKYGRA